MPRKSKDGKVVYRYPVPRIADAAALQQRIADGKATPNEERQYQRMMNELRRKFNNGALSPASARLFGFE